MIREDVKDRYLELERSDLSQIYVLDVCPAYDVNDEKIHILKVFSNAYGGSGMYNKMFLDIRNKHGLAYSCGCFVNQEYTKNISSFTKYAMISAEKMDEYSLCLSNMNKEILNNGLSKELIDCAKAKELYSVAKSSTNEWSLAKYASKMFFGELISPKDRTEIIKNITYDEVNDVARDILKKETIRVVLKPKD